MYLAKLIFLLVQLCLIVIRVKSSGVEIIYTNQYDNNESIAINETENLHMMTRLNSTSITHESCSGSCSVKKTKLDLTCNVIITQDTRLNVSIKGKITKDLSGEWRCTFHVIDLRNQTRTKIHVNSDFHLNVKPPAFFSFTTLLWIGSAVVIFIVLLVCIIQTWCILHFRRKAKAVSKEAWSNRKNENTEDVGKTVRYSKMPGLKKQEVLIPESRESGIYEALENIRVAPEPPPVTTLPSKKAAKKAPPTPTESPASNQWGTMALNSLLRKKNKKEEESETDSKTSTLDKRTSLDRIKKRLPIPIPTEEDLYEAMETPPPVRKELKKNVAKEKPAPKEGKAFGAPKQLPAHVQPKPKGAVPLPTNIGGVGSVQPAMDALLKQAVEKRNHLNPVQPQLQTPPPKPQPKTQKEPPRQNPTPQPPIPKLKPWQKETQAPKTKVTPEEPTKPKAKVWLREETTPKQKEWPKEPSQKDKVWPRENASPEEQRPVGSNRPKVTPYNPGLPPPDAPPAKIRTPWGEVIPPKPRPPPPAKPKQLHPLPQPPSDPETIHVVTEHDDDRDSDESEEWVYEQLPQYNIYSM